MNDQPTPKPELDPVSKYQIDEMRAERKFENDRRNEPELRLAGIRLVEAFADIFTEAAAELARRRGQDNPLGEDDARADLLWAFQEFITRGEWLTSDLENDLPKHFQLTRRHAAYWFDVDLDGYGEPIKPEGE